ncbi:MAG TPA: alkaline phosphatase family protein [Fimbriimonas sp.]|nr:alkaline phosphatase family protein [Fimbriimonas sp.]
MVQGRILVSAGVVLLISVGIGLARFQPSGSTTPTGKVITPLGEQTEVGSFPVNMVASPDGKFLLVTNCGFRQQVSVLDSTSGKLLSRIEFNGEEGKERKSLYFGIAAVRSPTGGTEVAVSRGSEDKVSLYNLSDSGELSSISDVQLPAADNPLNLPNHVAGLAWSPDGSHLYAVGNQSHAFNDFRGSLFTIDPAAARVVTEVKVGSFPLAATAAPDGSVFVANEGGREVTRLTGGVGMPQTINTGEAPTYLTMDHAGKTLFVSNSNSDTISFVNLADSKIKKTVLLRPDRLKGLPGATPLGSVVSGDDKTLFVALGDLNAVGVVDIPSGRLRGYIPAGWYPTSVALSPDGSSLFVANAKGVQTLNPNGKPVRTWGQYGPNIIEGTVSKIALSDALSNLPAVTVQVLNNNSGFSEPQDKEHINNPGIKHIVYIIKENRTYDQVLGDEAGANGDPSLVMFGKDVTPNQHALAERFGLFDNFYVCAEVSADGWNWSTSGMGNAYTERNVPYNYSGRGRNYDFEGANNDSPVSLLGRRDVATAPGGYLWDAFLKKGLTVRDYGMFNSDGNDAKGPDGKPIAEDNRPTKPNLVSRTCTDYRDFDMAFADSEAWVKLGLTPAPRQMKAYGSHHDPSRVTTWLREFNQYVQDGNMPNLTLIRLPHNHTSGTAAGMSSPRAMVADNDFAVGQIVEAISHSPFWKSTAIFIVEDDAQAGFDHVDSHRSPTLVISPYTKARVDSRFYNTDSTIRTMEELMGVPPHNEYVATARHFYVFGRDAVNADPYNAIMPSKEILGEVNERSAYRSADSDLLIKRFSEESEADFELNDILWHSIKGRRTPIPKTPGALWHVVTSQDDD